MDILVPTLLLITLFRSLNSEKHIRSLIGLFLVVFSIFVLIFQNAAISGGFASGVVPIDPLDYYYQRAGQFSLSEILLPNYAYVGFVSLFTRLNVLPELISIFLLKISNGLFISLSLVLLYKLVNKLYSQKVALSFLKIILLNPVLYFTASRVLKDSLVFLAASLFMYAWFHKKAISTVISVFLLVNLRPVFLVLIPVMLVRRISQRKWFFWALIIAGYGVIILLLPLLIQYIPNGSFAATMAGNAGFRGYPLQLNYMLGTLRVLFLPILPSSVNYSLNGTWLPHEVLGQIMNVGLSIWLLIIFILAIPQFRKRPFLILLIFATFAPYIIIYWGNMDSRLKIVYFAVLSLLAAITWNDIKKTYSHLVFASVSSIVAITFALFVLAYLN